MAFRLSKTDSARLEKFQAELNTWREQIDNEFLRVTLALGAAVQDINAMIERHNAAISDARVFVLRVSSEFRDAYDEKSERWQESDAGQAASGFVEDWEHAHDALRYIDPVCVVLPDAPETKCKDLDLPTESD